MATSRSIRVPIAIPLGLAALHIVAPAHAHLSIVRQVELAGEAEPQDRFGVAVAAGDFNGDGFDDLAVGSPGEALGAQVSAGVVTIGWGGASGVQHAGSVELTAVDFNGTVQLGAQLGTSLLAIDLNLDGFDDLLVGAPNENVSGSANAGRVYLAQGSPAGLLPWLSITQSFPEPSDLWGYAIVAGHFNEDEWPDLAVSAPGENDGWGHVTVIEGTAAGPLGLRQAVTQNTFGETAEPGDFFGLSLAVGNILGDDRDDLVIGAPYKDAIGGTPQTGMIFIARGGPVLVEPLGTFHQGSGDGLDIGALFGYSLAIGELYGSGTYEALAVGEPRRTTVGTSDAGLVTVYPGGPEFIEIGQRIRIDQNDAGGVIEPGDEFGTAVAIGPFDRAPGEEYEDLAVGAPGDGLGFTSRAGQINVFRGGPSGPIGTGWAGYNQATLNERIESDAQLGFSLAFGRFDEQDRSGLAVGAPGDDVGRGMVHVINPWRQLYGMAAGASIVLDCEGEIYFSQRPFDTGLVASTTKIMTVLLACERAQLPPSDPGYVDLATTYVVPDWVADQIPGSQLNLIAGETISLLDLLRTCLGVSGNDCAHAIADILGGVGGPNVSVPAFVADMNARAAQIGMTATHFNNPAGFEQEWVGPDLGDHYSTSLDMAVLSRFAMQNVLFADIASDVDCSLTRHLPGGIGDIPQTCVNGFVAALGANLAEANGVKGGGTPLAGITGCFSAESMTEGGNTIATSLATPEALSAQYIPDAVGLLSLGLSGCGDDVDVPGTWVTEFPSSSPFSSGNGEQSSSIADHVLTEGDVRLFTAELVGGEPGPAHVEIQLGRLSTIQLEPLTLGGQFVDFGIDPFQSALATAIVNMGYETATIAVEHPATTEVIVMEPGESVIISELSFPGEDDFVWQLANFGSSTASLYVEETYVFEPEIVSDSPFTAAIRRPTGTLWEGLRMQTLGLDEGPGAGLVGGFHQEGTVLAADEPALEVTPDGAVGLLAPRPNPFRRSTQIGLVLGAAGSIAVELFDVTGRLVRAYPERDVPAGRWRLTWDGRDADGRIVSPGCYYYRILREGTVAATGRMVRVP